MANREGMTASSTDGQVGPLVYEVHDLLEHALDGTVAVLFSQLDPDWFDHASRDERDQVLLAWIGAHARALTAITLECNSLRERVAELEAVLEHRTGS